MSKSPKLKAYLVKMANDPRVVNDERIIAVYKTAARAEWHAKRFHGRTEEVLVDVIYQVCRYNRAVREFYLTEAEAHAAATNPNYSNGEYDISKITNKMELGEAHAYCQNYEVECRREYRYERMHS